MTEQLAQRAGQCPHLQSAEIIGARGAHSLIDQVPPLQQQHTILHDFCARILIEINYNIMDHSVPVIHNQDDEPSGSWSNVHSESLPEGSDGPPPSTFIDNHSSKCFEDHGALLRPCTTSRQFVFELGWFVLSKLVPMPSDREKILMPVKGYISHSGDVPSPIEKLPPEIMCEPWTDHSLQIFGLLSASRRPCLMVGCPALQLAKVCSSWRKTVLGNPSLWSSLYIETESLNTYPQLASLVKLYIVYSRSAPLTFFIRTQAEATHEMNQTLNLLIENSKRWKSAKIDIADAGFTPNFLLSRSLKNTCGILELSVPTPNLEDLEIDNHNWRNTACKIFPVCPRLKKFTANHLSWGPAFTGHNFFELVELHMGSDGGLFGPSIAHFLLGMPSLQTASIAKFCKTDDVAAELTSPHESSVTSLRIWTDVTDVDEGREEAWSKLSLLAPGFKTFKIIRRRFRVGNEWTSESLQSALEISLGVATTSQKKRQKSLEFGSLESGALGHLIMKMGNLYSVWKWNGYSQIEPNPGKCSNHIYDFIGMSIASSPTGVIPHSGVSSSVCVYGEMQYKRGIDKMAKLYQADGDKELRQDAESRKVESEKKIQLLQLTRKRYKICIFWTMPSPRKRKNLTVQESRENGKKTSEQNLYLVFSQLLFEVPES
ncbi:hypothetical protein C8J55DRAFT_490348 [Lentinula edodes]|uniref:REM-1 domain-containing protein n=1 Tax=Lentinula lateritia TaxID=40482 RepID=A0A9W9A8F3_9AGAR|nr:hypothetical protein C8J55DRAFT_490348 [Lentinula edodes]